MNERILSLRNLSAYYGTTKAVESVSIEVPRGGMVAILGANGAGKSTILRAISNWVRSEGEIEFNGASTKGLSPDGTARLGIAHVPEGREIFPSLSVLHNLMMGTFAGRRKHAQVDLEAVFSYFPKLEQRQRQAASSLSGGEQQMLVIGRALISNPELVLLDEPSLGLSPQLVDEIFRNIARINEERQVSVLLVEQNAMRALRLASYAYIMEAGQIVAEGKSALLLKSPEVRAAYLGLNQ
ncbi:MULTISPECIES: ABC transporter ATP-binding protein [unclassified Variovorax]|uniref:ABC transporter ATP-binding protein n=1 Tax=unclassified Variovorax TaxID=663243 RepID=UPI001BD60FAA|nr:MULTISPECIES: ABC transporter ATP-binding protein [unclassified Variovorax]